jgi:hypothetical protein
MGCCGQGRAALRAVGESSPARPNISRASPPTHRNRSPPTGGGGPPAATVLRYLGGKHARIRGMVGGRLYEFNGGERTAVEARDAPTMVRTGLFTRD